MSIVEASLERTVALHGGRIPVRVRARGVGVLRVGDVRRMVWGRFQGVLRPRAEPTLVVRFWFSRVLLRPFVAPAPCAPAVPDLLVAMGPPRLGMEVCLRSEVLNA